MGRERFRLAQDDSSHWYIIPADQEDAWVTWFELDEGDDKWDVPEWAVRIDGSPTNVTFTDWKDGE